MIVDAKTMEHVSSKGCRVAVSSLDKPPTVLFIERYEAKIVIQNCFTTGKRAPQSFWVSLAVLKNIAGKLYDFSLPGTVATSVKYQIRS